MKKFLFIACFLLNGCKQEPTVYLTYNKQYDSYVTSQQKLDNIINQGKIPNLKIKGIKSKRNAPTIGFLLSKEPNLYSISASNAHSIIDAGGNIKLLDYINNIKQMQNIDGLYLAGGYFNSPKEFYQHAMPQNYSVDTRGLAYLSSIKEAQAKKIPILGVCAGAQMLGGTQGIKMNNAISSNIKHHQPADIIAHKVTLQNKLKDMFNKQEISVNSMHNEALDINTIPNSSLQIYATSPDGILEAFGSENKKILAVQWHPETLYYKLKDQNQLKIFQWLVNLSKKY